MDADKRVALRFLAVILTTVIALAGSPHLRAADYRTQNFIVMAPTHELAQAVGDSAEAYRRDLAQHWLGQTLPPWPSPCPIRVIAGNMPAQGMTQYNRSPVRDFQMEVVGTPERILDSVLPHEVTHTILATHFGRPLPRWADEGICTTVEHESERAKHEQKLREFLRSRRGIAMNKLFLLTEYPADVLPMYAQGYSVCQFLIAQRGAQQFVQFLGDYMQRPSWTDNVRAHYGYQSLAELQENWLAWVAQGNGPVDQFAKIDLNRGAGGQASIAQVAAATPSNDGRSDLAMTSPNALNTPGPPIEQLASRSAISLAGAEPSADGWYSRLRREAVTDNTPGLAAQTGHSGQTRASMAGRAQDPPSIYSAAQPQPEFGAGSVGVQSGGVHSGGIHTPQGTNPYSGQPSYSSPMPSPSHSLWR